MPYRASRAVREIHGANVTATTVAVTQPVWRPSTDGGDSGGRWSVSDIRPAASQQPAPDRTDRAATAGAENTPNAPVICAASWKMVSAASVSTIQTGGPAQPGRSTRRN